MSDLTVGLLPSILANIITSIAGFAVGCLFNYLKRILDTNRTIKNLKLVCDKEENYIDCYTATPPLTTESLEGNLGYVYEYMAICTLQSALPKLSLNVFMPDPINIDSKLEHPDNHLILIGGPVHNPATRELIFNNNFPFSFDSKNNLIYTKNNQTTVFQPERDPNGKVVVDIALVVVTNHPNNSNKKIIALIGCHSLGCYVAACYIKYGINKGKKIKDENYAIVVRSKRNTLLDNGIFNDGVSKDVFDKNDIFYIRL